MSKPRLGTLCTGPVYIFDCEVEDYQATERSRARAIEKAKEAKPKSSAAGKRTRKSNRKPRP